MNTRKRNKTLLTLVALAVIALIATSANAQIKVTSDHIVSIDGEPNAPATGTLIAIDVPYVDVAAFPASGGPDWSEDADDGFVTFNSPLQEYDDTSRWEPDGTPIAEAMAFYTYHPSIKNCPTPGVKYVFDIPDGAIVNAIYATWNTRGTDGCTYQYSEGTASGSIPQLQEDDNPPAADMVLRWTDSDSATHDGEFQRMFTGPITVTGGDGFEVWATDNLGNAAHIDAVVLDVSFDDNLPGVEIATKSKNTFSGQTIELAGSVTAGTGDPNPTYSWSTAPNSSVDLDIVISDTPLTPSITITKNTPTGGATTVTVMLSASNEDDDTVVTATITIDVYDDACQMGTALDSITYDKGDINKDCITNLADFARLAIGWMDDYAATETATR
jgi:hypothetical protein